MAVAPSSRDYAPMQAASNPMGRSNSNGKPAYRHSDSEEDDSEDASDQSFLHRLMEDGTPLNTKFQMTTTIVILLCTVSMAIETDYYPDCALWWWWNTAVLVYFCLELGARLSYHRWKFFACSEANDKDCISNYFDLIIVVICIVVQWIEPMIRTEGSDNLEILKVFRIFRILRTLRVLRIFRACTQLNNLALGLLDSLSTVFWIALLMLMFMLIFAIILTDVAGNQAKLAKKPGDLFFDSKEDIEMYWGSVGKSLATFFQFLTLDDWTNISRQVYDEIPTMWVVFFLYIFLMGFAMLSLLTGVVAERMSEVSTDQKKSQRQDDDKDLMQFLDQEMLRLEEEVSPGTYQVVGGLADRRGMSREEFARFLSLPQVVDKLKEMDACLAEHEADEFWDCLDRNEDGVLSHQELKAGFLRLRGELQPKDMLRIRYAAERVARRLQGGQGEAATTRKLEEINDDLSEVEAKLKTMQGRLNGFHAFLQKRGSFPARSITKRVVTGKCCA